MILLTAAFTAAHNRVCQQGDLPIDALHDGLGLLVRQGQILHHLLRNLGGCVLIQVELETNGLDLPCTIEVFIRHGNDGISGMQTMAFRVPAMRLQGCEKHISQTDWTHNLNECKCLFLTASSKGPKERTAAA